jgi:hypothetical protein
MWSNGSREIRLWRLYPEHHRTHERTDSQALPAAPEFRGHSSGLDEPRGGFRALGEASEPFRSMCRASAKKFLGIRSVRSGFGDEGKWFWRLERRPASPVSHPLAQPLAGRVSSEDTYAGALEEVPADVRPRRIPSSWIDGVARLEHHRPLTDIPPHRWRQFLSDCNKFLTGGENWAGRAAELGWNAASLFGCRRVPHDNQDERPATIKMRMAPGGG